MKTSHLLAISYLILFGYFAIGILYTADYVNYKITEDSDVQGYAEYNLYNVTIEILNNGSLKITEIINVSLVAYEGAFKFGYRIMNIRGFDDIVNFKAYEKINGSLLQLNTELIKAFGKVGMKFYFANPITNGIGYFVLSYTVVNAIWSEGSKNYLKWVPFPEQHPPIKSANFEVIIPKNTDVEIWTDRNADFNIHKEENRTVILGSVGYLDTYETIKLEVSFNKFIEPEFSIRKYLSSSSILYIIVVVVLLYLVAMCAIVYSKESREEIVNPDRVINELDPIEFSYLKILSFNPIVVLSGIFYLGVKKLVKIEIKDKALRLHKGEIENTEGLSPWAKYLYDKLTENDIENKEITRRELTELSESLKKFDTMQEKSMEEELISRGYLKISIFENIEGTAKGLAYTILAMALIGIILHVYGIVQAFKSIFILGSFISIVPLIILIAIPRQTPLGLGALKAIKERAKIILENMKIGSEEELRRSLETFFGVYLPYVIPFTQVLRLLKRNMKHSRYAWIPYYIYHYPIISSHDHTGTGEKMMIEPINIGELIDKLTKFLITLTPSTSGTGGISSVGGGGGFGGGGISGFG